MPPGFQSVIDVAVIDTDLPNDLKHASTIHNYLLVVPLTSVMHHDMMYHGSTIIDDFFEMTFIPKAPIPMLIYLL